MESNKIIGYTSEDFVNASKGLNQCGVDLHFKNPFSVCRWADADYILYLNEKYKNKIAIESYETSLGIYYTIVTNNTFFEDIDFHDYYGFSNLKIETKNPCRY